jgi:PAS domain-containing protein
MRAICAWCRKELRRVDSEAHSENLITHGICDECKDNLDFQMGVDLQIFLDSLGAPILVVNGEGAVVTGNGPARTLLGKGLAEVEGYKGGEVFECEHARLPEGCGNTVHCSGCVIRKTVMETYETGKSFQKVPATLDRSCSEDAGETDLLISTERLADVVLLRIDKLEAKHAARETSKSGI